MPELPEVGVLLHHLAPLLRGKRVQAVDVNRPKVVLPQSPAEFRRRLIGARFVGVARRAKFLVFELRFARGERFHLLGHLGMTGRFYVAPAEQPPPKHAAVLLGLGRVKLVYEDPRYFGRLSLDTSPLAKLGPEPLGTDFTPEAFAKALQRSTQAIKVKLLDQTLLAGVGNIYASEALHAASIPPRRAARRLTAAEVTRLHTAIRRVLARAIRFGSTIPLSFDGRKGNGLFYYGRSPERPGYDHERLRVYDREGQACARCGETIRRILQANRSTYYCPGCQPKRPTARSANDPSASRRKP